MSQKIPVHNATKMPIYVASVMIPPGETRHFQPEQVPPEYHPAPVTPETAATPVDAIAELSARKVADIVAAIPGLSDEDLTRLGDLEQAKGDAARKGVLGPIAEAILTRAGDRAAGGEPGADGGGTGEGGAQD